MKRHIVTLLLIATALIGSACCTDENGDEAGEFNSLFLKMNAVDPENLLKKIGGFLPDL